MSLVTVNGGCHCGTVRWSLKVLPDATIWDCNCSICIMKNNKHVVVPETQFTIISGKDNLTCYRFNTKKAKHLFCETCGVQSFYRPRSNPDGIGVNPICIDKEDLSKVSFKKEVFDGQNWESHIEKSNITTLSKL